MDDAVEAYLAASKANDVDGLLAALTPDAELVSPIAGSMVFRGHEDLRVVLPAIYGSLTAVRWHDRFHDGRVSVVLGRARIGPVRLDDAMLLERADDGRIRRVTPHLRPWLATTLLALRLGPKIAASPQVVRRALRHGRQATGD